MIPQAGDVLLTRSNDFIGWAIRKAEARRYGGDSGEAQFNHAALLVDSFGTIIEALSSGLQLGRVANYDKYVILRPPYPNDLERDFVVKHARERLLAGHKYGFLTIVSLALAYLTGTRLRFGMRGEDICSGFVSTEVELGDVFVGEDDPEWNSPADILQAATFGKWVWIEKHL